MVKLRESLNGALVDSPSESRSGKRWRVKVIEAGKGSSAIYPENVLRDYASVFEAGTQMYLDHPGKSEESDRPERSVRDLVGRLVSEAEYKDGALYAEAEFLPWAAPAIEALSDMVGLSIRAYGTVTESDDGPVLTSFSGVESVDVVTKAGAGGQFVELLESARAKNVEEAKSSDIHSSLTDLVASETGMEWGWVRDFDPDKQTVWYTADSGTYEQQYETTNGLPSALIGERTKVIATTEYVSIGESASVTTQKEKSMTPEQEAKLDALVESISSLSEQFSTVAESLKAPEPVVEEDAAPVDALEAAKALAASELSEAGQAMAIARVSESVSLEEAINAQKEYEDSVRQSVGNGYHVVEERKEPVKVPFKKVGA